MAQIPDRPTAAELARIARAETAPNAAHRGEVYLVGAGPGDPELLTLRASELMRARRRRALRQPRLRRRARARSPPASSGSTSASERANHTMPQEEINELLVRHAREGKRVLRLKGGDPFMFGRGGEEIDSLAANGIPFEVVPGITAALGVAAYRRHSADASRLRAGLPVRHRPPEGRQHGPRLAGAGAAAADGGRLHGPAGPADAVREADRARPEPPTCRRPSSSRARRATQRVVTGTLRDAAGAVAERAMLHGADADHRRRRRAAARAAQLVRPGRPGGYPWIGCRWISCPWMRAPPRPSRTSPRRDARPRTPRPRRASAGPASTGCGGRAA